MKFLVALLSLICVLLAHLTSALPNPVDLNVLQSAAGRLGIPNFNCVIHCVQPSGAESDDADANVRGILSNYATLADCIKKCSS